MRALHWSFLRTALAFLLAWSLVWVPSLSMAGDLNAEVNQMFNDLGGVGNYTAPGAFKGQVFNTYSGGSLYLRTPNKTYTLAAMSFPSAKAGCSGIDIWGGSFSHISAAEFKNMLKNITSALPGIAFQLALEAVSPLLGGLSKWADGIATMVNNARINSCETAKGLVSTAAEAAGYDSQEACAKLAVQLGLESDADAARRRCQTDRPGILASARTSADADIKAQAPFIGNIVWQALKAVPTLDDKGRELIMSIVGTTIYYPEEAKLGPQTVQPTITNVTNLLYGQGAAANGAIYVQVLRCNNYVDCDQVTVDNTYTHVPFTKYVEDLMHSISDKIETRTPLPNNSAEVGFVNSTSEPVWRMLSIGKTIPGSGLAESLIQQYKEVIAADYAYHFLEQNLRLGMSSLSRSWYLNDVQRDDLKRMRTAASDMLTLLAQEKTSLYAKKSSIASAATYFEQLERSLRSSLPQHIIDMLGQSAKGYME